MQYLQSCAAELVEGGGSAISFRRRCTGRGWKGRDTDLSAPFFWKKAAKLDDNLFPRIIRRHQLTDRWNALRLIWRHCSRSRKPVNLLAKMRPRVLWAFPGLPG